MLFSSPIFLLLFLPTTIVLNFFLKTKYSNLLLLGASLVFYAWGEPVYVFLMLFSVAMNWSFGILISRIGNYRKFALTVCIVLNLAILGYYKYFNFFAGILNGFVHTELIKQRNIVLPIGISFFTFQALSYVIDLYRGNCKIQKNILNLALYVSFFPQLIAGPIVRYSDIDNQISNRTVSVDKFAIGLRRFLYGLGKKVLISNCMAEIADAIFEQSFAGLTAPCAWLGAIAYTMQIYYDFSGYSDMAIGLGKMFGFDFLENFRYPYLSKSIREFWQRWHISLGTWFREYVYIPLGGNRRGKFRTYMNLFVVFLLTGMWHGASWTFLLWGLYHGTFQVIERLGLKKYLDRHTVISHIYCMLVVVIGWVLFRAETLMDAYNYIISMFTPWRGGFGGLSHIPAELTLRNGIFIFFAVFGSGILQKATDKVPVLSSKWKYSWVELGYLCLVFAYSMIRLAAGTYNPFIYFRF